MKKIILMFLLFVSTLFANIGKITLLEGEAFVKRGEETLRLNLSDQISNNDFIETKTNSKVKITFMDNTIITIGKESSLKIEDYFFDSNNKNSAKTELNVSKGAFHAITGQIGKVNPEKFKLKTKNATIGIRGTEIYGDQNRVFCTQGAIFVNTFDNQIPSQSTPIDQQQFQDVNSNLNNNSLDNNQNPNNFDNPSSPLAFQNSQSPEMNQNQDNQNSWGYWGTARIQDENNNARLNQYVNNSIQNSNTLTENTTYVQNLMNNATTTDLNFNGTINVPNIPSIGTNFINLYFHFGSSNNTFSANYGFEGENNNNFGGTLNGTITSTGFSGNNISGVFNGANIDSVSGNITMDRFVEGTFSANKQ